MNAWASNAAGCRRYKSYFLSLVNRTRRVVAAFVSKGVDTGRCAQRVEPSHAPASLRQWIAECPPWLDVLPVDLIDDETLRSLGIGERAAITLALSLHADLILMDERKGTSIALLKGLEVTGTLGILRLGARERLIDLAEAITKLKSTNFRYRQEMLDGLLDEFSGNGP